MEQQASKRRREGRYKSLTERTTQLRTLRTSYDTRLTLGLPSLASLVPPARPASLPLPPPPSDVARYTPSDPTPPAPSPPEAATFATASTPVPVGVVVTVGMVTPSLALVEGVGEEEEEEEEEAEAEEEGGAVTSQVCRMALLSIRLMNSNPKYLAPSTSASSSGLEADKSTWSVCV